MYQILVMKVLHFNMKDLKRSFIVKVTPSIINKDTYHILMKGKSSKSIKSNRKKLIKDIKRYGGEVHIINIVER